MPTKKRTFRLRDLYAHRTLSSPTATPDGRMVAFAASQPDVKANKNVTEIWAWSEGRGTWQVTFGGSAGSPCFSPNGRRLAFLSDRGGKKQQVVVMDLCLSEGRKVTDFDEGVVSLRWSPDGRRLAVIAKADKTPEEKKRDERKEDWWTVDADERRRALWIVRADGGGKPRRVSLPAEHLSNVAWTPDGRRLVYIACPVASINSQWFESELKTVGATGRGRRTVCPVRGHMVETRMTVAPDGRRLLLCQPFGERDQWHDTGKIIDLRTGRARPVAPGCPHRQMNLQWLPDGRVCFESDVGTSFKLFVTRPGGKPRMLPTGDGAAAYAVPAAKADRLFYLYSEPGQPDEICMIPLDGSAEPVQVTDVNRSMGRVRLAACETVRWKTKDGLEIEGLLYLPTKPGARKPYPLMVLPHGGPYGSSVASYTGSAVPNLYCAAGYACLLPNFRGSTGRGRLFTRKIVRDWGDGPFGDIMAGVDALIRRGVGDGKRMAVVGGSYGGYMTAWAVGHTRRFRAAVAVAAVINNLSMWGTTDIPGFQLFSSGGPGPSFTDKYWRDQSPLYHADKVRTPTLVITGEVDARVPPSQSHEFYRALKHRGVETRLILYPREPHGVSEPRHRLAYFKQILDWVNPRTLG